MSGSADGLQSVANQTLDNTLGAAFLGIVGASILFGITSLQGYLYYHRYYRDSRRHKFAVAVLWILDTLHLILIVHAVYHYAVKGFGNISKLSTIVWSIKLQVAINVIIILIVQSLYAYRVWILGGYHHGVLGYVVACVVAGGFGVGAVLAYKVYTVDTFPGLSPVSWAIEASLATSSAIDFTIASAMCYYLHKSRGSGSRFSDADGHTRLNSRISTVMQYSLSSGLFTSACSLSTLFTYTLMPNSMVFLGLQFLSTKFYVGSFLAMLNARKRSRDQEADQPSSSHKPSIHFKIHTSTVTDSEAQHPSPISSSDFSSPTSSECDSTYVSFDHSESSKKSPWDIETLPVAMVYPLNSLHRNGSVGSVQRPDYMSQW